MLNGVDPVEPERVTRRYTEEEEKELVLQYVDKAEIEAPKKKVVGKDKKPPLAAKKVPPAEKMKKEAEDRKRRVTRLPREMLIDNRER